MQDIQTADGDITPDTMLIVRPRPDVTQSMVVFRPDGVVLHVESRQHLIALDVNRHDEPPFLVGFASHDFTHVELRNAAGETVARTVRRVADGTEDVTLDVRNAAGQVLTVNAAGGTFKIELRDAEGNILNQAGGA